MSSPSAGLQPWLVAATRPSDTGEDRQTVVLVGPVGTGKTHLATALGIEAARRRHRVAWFRAAELVRTLLEAKGARELGRL